MFCRKCGKELEDDWNTCPYCGEPVDNRTDELGTMGNIKKSPGKQKLWIGVGAAAVVIAAVAIGVMVGKTGSSTKNGQQTVKENSAENGEKSKEKKIKEVKDFSSQDFETMIGTSISELEEAGLKKVDGKEEYTGLNGSIQVTCQGEMIESISIEGEEATTPSFHKTRLGMSMEEVKNNLAEAYPEQEEAEGILKFLNLEKKSSVECSFAEEKLNKIHYRVLSEEEVVSYQQAKEEKLRAEFIFPDSDKKYLSEGEIRAKTVEDLMVGRNEIFARHGYMFEDAGLKSHFESTSWYQGTVPSSEFNSEQVFNEFEKKNVELIKKVEDEINGEAAKEAERQAAINEGYNHIVGNSYNYRGWQLVIEFQTSDTVRVCYGGEILDDYFNYSITARYEENKDAMSWLKYITINGVEYYLRCFTDGSIHLSGAGEFDGWYDKI